jgi:hypothetical protein
VGSLSSLNTEICVKGNRCWCSHSVDVDGHRIKHLTERRHEPSQAQAPSALTTKDASSAPTFISAATPLRRHAGATVTAEGEIAATVLYHSSYTTTVHEAALASAARRSSASHRRTTKGAVLAISTCVFHLHASPLPHSPRLSLAHTRRSLTLLDGD